MPKLKNTVVLTEEEIQMLKALTHKGSGESARTIMHANILLFTNDGLGDKKKGVREISELFEISPTTVNQVRKLYVASGIEAAFNRKTRLTPPHVSKITGEFEAQVIATALAPAPEGRARCRATAFTIQLFPEHTHCLNSIQVVNSQCDYNKIIIPTV